MTEFFCVAYIFDLAANPNFQRIGPGKQLNLKLRNKVTSECKLFFLAAPVAVDYFPHIEFAKEDRGWVVPLILDVNK
jgi:hypothetical protein